MARPKRRKLKFDEESMNNLLQEIYNECHNIKAKLTRLFTKWEQKIKETGEIAAIGDQIVKLIAAEAKNQDQKIILLKYLKEVVFNDRKTGGTITMGNLGEDEKGEVTTDRRNELITMIEEELEKREENKTN